MPHISQVRAVKSFSGHYRPVSFTSFTGKTMEQIVPEAISRHMQDKNVTRNSQHEFSMSLTNPTAFASGRIGCVG